MIKTYELKTYKVRAIFFNGSKESLDEIADFIKDVGRVGSVIHGNPEFEPEDYVFVDILVNHPIKNKWVLCPGDYVYFDKKGVLVISTSADFDKKFAAVAE